jgi:hypothetical protein
VSGTDPGRTAGAARTAERWGVFELPVAGPGDEVVFTDGGGRRFTAAVFTGDEGAHLVRFMPDAEGEWHYRSAEVSGTFTCVPPAPGNHGPVHVAGERSFRYADGHPFHPVGTSVGDAGPTTLRTLADAPFNRVRLLGSADLPLGVLDEQVAALLALGIEAEVDLAGRFAADPGGGDGACTAGIAETVARLAAYRNVWWRAPRDPDAQTTIREHDHGHRLLTVHGGPATDFGAPWLTHASLRLEDPHAVAGLGAALGKPVVVDDCGAEGDGPVPRRSLTAAELVARIWEGVCQGGHVTHGEAYGTRPWLVHGGGLAGESAPRLAFLRGILDDAPAGLVHDPVYYDASTLVAPGEYWLQYLGPHRYPYRRFELPPGGWHVEVLDTWRMTVDPPRRVAGGRVEVQLPADPYCAIRIRRAPGA